MQLHLAAEAHTIIRLTAVSSEKEPHSTLCALVIQRQAAVWAHDGDSRLYGLSLDPLELDDQAAAQPDKAAVMVRHIQDWQRMVAAASLDPELKSEEPLDDATLERLKSLGYIH